MLSTVAQAALVCGGVWLFWKFVRRFVVKSTLDNLPGPESPSFLYGAYQTFTYVGPSLRMILQETSNRSTTSRDGIFTASWARNMALSADSMANSGYVLPPYLLTGSSSQFCLLSKRSYMYMTRRLCTPLRSRSSTSMTKPSGG